MSSSNKHLLPVDRFMYKIYRIFEIYDINKSNPNSLNDFVNSIRSLYITYNYIAPIGSSEDDIYLYYDFIGG
jgi:hypothetical protein